MQRRVGRVEHGGRTLRPAGRPVIGALVATLLAAQAAARPPGCRIDVGQLTGADGFALLGGAANDRLGTAVSCVGDLNDDGFDDVVVGALNAGGTGRAYVVFGTDQGFPAALDAETLAGAAGFVIHGAGAGDGAGIAVSGAGDVNGDGIDDLLIGARNADPGGHSNAGAAYVVFGSAGGFASPLLLSSLDGTNGFTMNGIAPSDFVGTAVSSAGDFNGDGTDDVVLGAFGVDPGGRSLAGAVYVVFGTNLGFAATVDLSTLDGTDGLVLNGESPIDLAGVAVSCAGDFNGDGIDDVIIGASGADPGAVDGAGRTYVVFGTNLGFSAALELSTIDGTNGVAIDGIAMLDSSGSSVASAGDLDGDLVDDVVIGAPSADPAGVSGAGEAYVVYGTSLGFTSPIALSTLDGSNGLVLTGGAAGDGAGWSVSCAGDVSGDGIDDLLVGARNADPPGAADKGETYVVFGGGSLPSAIDLTALGDTDGFPIGGDAGGDQAGGSVSAAGDVNGDGAADVLVGAASAGSGDAGAAYVVLGSLDCDGDGLFDGCATDCNVNGIPDACDVDPTDPDGDGLVSPDCDGDGVPDECEPDCNANGVADDCDLTAGTSFDCNGDGIPDECQVDCNENGLHDSCDIASGTSNDVDGNGVPDECKDDCNGNGIPDYWEILQGTTPDCNANGVPDECDIGRGDSQDANGNGVPDECDPDCNANGVPDDLDIAGGTSQDCNTNTVPDECDLAAGAPDANGNGIPDECDPDCNGNGTPDDLDIGGGTSQDCNGNTVPDECDIAAGAPDANGNGIPDECEPAPCPEDCGDPADGQVDVTDLLAVLAQWGQAGTTCDANGSGAVEVGDLLAVLAEWGPCP
ncbi:MAG: hypothetical protein ACYTG1_03835 [Planctomycetota bacterium]|jgi:hypothetical protein